jgi:hypothetical protein
MGHKRTPQRATKTRKTLIRATVVLAFMHTKSQWLLVRPKENSCAQATPAISGYIMRPAPAIDAKTHRLQLSKARDNATCHVA